jgi:hypothetical protein
MREPYSDSTVAIKPNLCCVKPHETGTTTDPRVVEAIITFLKVNPVSNPSMSWNLRENKYLQMWSSSCWVTKDCATD